MTTAEENSLSVKTQTRPQCFALVIGDDLKETDLVSAALTTASRYHDIGVMTWLHMITQLCAMTAGTQYSTHECVLRQLFLLVFI